MGEGGEQLELKFRIFDGTDIGHGSYSSSITVATLKQRLLSEWPQGCDSVLTFACVLLNVLFEAFYKSIIGFLFVA